MDAYAISDSELDEALSFLSARPLHTVIMAGLLRDHGPRVSVPRGEFYACRDSKGSLQGVALIGRATMFEARSPAALSAFATETRRCASVRMVMGSAGDLRKFWKTYAEKTTSVRLRCRELFYNFSSTTTDEATKDLRLATEHDLEKIVAAHAEMVFEETGVNPLAADPEGFSQRCLQRVNAGRVWTLFEGGKLIFKADVVTQTPEAAYIEGVWVNPTCRYKGHGKGSLRTLKHILLKSVPNVCGFVNAKNESARKFYESAGGSRFANYSKIYL